MRRAISTIQNRSPDPQSHNLISSSHSRVVGPYPMGRGRQFLNMWTAFQLEPQQLPTTASEATASGSQGPQTPAPSQDTHLKPRGLIFRHF